MKSYHIRHAIKDDIDTIVNFNRAMAKETEDINLPLQRLRNGVAGVFEDSTRGFYVVAERNGEVIGQTLVTDEWSDWRNGVFWWIQSVYVLPDYRRAHVFRSLFQYIKNTAEGRSGICGFRLYVDRSNFSAKQAYESLGMEESSYELYEMLL